MSKSLGNGVDLGEQLAAFGVDAVRMTMLFAGPPEDDIDWADMNVPALGKFLARAWRLAADVRSEIGVDVTTGDVALRRVTHRTVHDVTHLLDTFRFNVAIARVMELVNAIRKTIDVGPGPADPAVREAVEAVAVMLSLFAPYTAEDAWARLGHQPTVVHAGWPVVDPAVAGRGVRRLRRPDQRQGSRPPRRRARHRRGPRCASWRSLPRLCMKALDGRDDPHGRRPGTEARQRRGLGSAYVARAHEHASGGRRHRLHGLPACRIGGAARRAGRAAAGHRRWRRPGRGRGDRTERGCRRPASWAHGEHLATVAELVRRRLPPGVFGRRDVDRVGAVVRRDVGHCRRRAARRGRRRW